jgi:signal transduction histidine kinase
MPLMFFILLNAYDMVFRNTPELPQFIIIVDISMMVTGVVSWYINLSMVLNAAKNIQTERRLAEEKTLLESLHRTKSEFFGNISHEMKTPLTVIVTDMELAEQFINEGKLDEAKELIREASHKGMQMADIVTDALAFARGQETAKPMEKIDYGAVFVSTLAIFEPLIIKHGNTLKQDIAKLPPIIGNANRLADTLINLLFNANRHTDGGIVHVQWKENNGKYTLTVSDTGSGIPPELLPRVFERGVTGGSGTGLGLALVKSVVEAHGGEVAIDSKVGEGTTVTLVFPATAEDEI